MRVTKVRAVSVRSAKPRATWPFSKFSFRLPMLSWSSKKASSKTSTHRSRWPLLLAILFLLIAVPVAFWLNSRTPKVEAAWWNAGWQYRKRVAITNSGAATTNQRITVTLDTQALITANKMQADCDDLRITDASGKLLEHWITGNATHTCNTATTYVYVKLPTLPTTGSTLYFYYGSPSAVDAEVTLGKNNTPGLSCQDILDHGNSIGSGLYYIAPSGNDTSLVEAYCDMTTSGGGWTLIISQQNNIILTDYYTTAPRLTNDGAISYYINNDLKNVSESIWVTNQSDQTHTFTTADFTGPLITNAANFADAADLSTNGLLAGNSSPVVTHFQVGQVCSVAGCHVAASSSTGYCNPIAQIWDWHAPDTSATANENAHFGCKSAIESTWAKRGKWLFVKGLHNFSSNTTATLATEETTPGPIAYWKFDENSGTQIKDSSGNNLTGTIHGTTWLGPDQCVSGSCLYFNGTNTDYVEISDSPKFDIDGTAGFTYSAWIKGTSFSQAYNMIMGHYIPYFDVNNAGKLFAKVSVGGVQQTATGTTTLQTNQWYHVAVTYKDGYIKLYVNGQLDGQGGPFTGVVNNYDRNQFLGTWESNHSYVFKGYLDEMKIYPYALTDEQFIQEYNQGYSTIIGQQDQGAISDGLIGYWKLDESASPALDSSGNGKSLSWNGDATSSLGKFGNSIAQTDGGGGYLTITDTDNYFDLAQNNFSVTMWFKADSLSSPDAPELLSKRDGGAFCSGGKGYHLRVGYQNEIEFYLEGTSDCEKVVSANGAIQAGQWYHVVAVYDQQNGSRIFLNGQQSGATTNISVGNVDNAGNLRVGMGANGWEMAGKYDEVKIYKRALGANEISQLYNWAPGPVGYWKFDEGSGTTANDSSGNGNHSTAFGSSPSWVPGKYGSALKFDGVDDYVRVADSNSLDFGTNDFTIMAWVKNLGVNSAAAHQSIVSKDFANGTSPTGQYKWVFYTIIQGKMAFAANDVVQPMSTATYIGDNTWHHVAITRRNNDGYLFVDGKLVDFDANLFSSLSFSNDLPLYIGARLSGTNAFYNGLIDEVKIYNYSRSLQQIMQDLNAGHPAGGSPVGSQLSYWKFDEGGGQTTGDSIGSYHATLGATTTASTDDPTWKTGSECKFNSCLSFDGGDHLKLGTVVDSSNSHTFTMWLKSSDPVAGEKFLFDIATTRTVLGWPRTGGKIAYYDVSGWHDSTITPVNDGVWHHVAYVLDGTTSKGAIYIDGALSQGDIAYNPTTFNGAAAIGARYDASSYWFTGYLDEFKIYSSALTPEQILIDMNQNQAMNYGAGGDSEAAILTDGAGNPPIGYWKLDEGTGAVAKDSSGNGKDGTHAGAGWGVGKYGNAANFDGNDTISIPNMTGLGSTDFTIQGWINARTQPGFYSSMILSSTAGFVLYLNQPTMNAYAQMYNGTGWTGIGCTTSTPFNEWHHLALVYTESSTSMNFYYDGKKCAGPTTLSGGFNNSYNTTFNIGSYTGTYHDGLIDDVKVYNYARTAGQIAYDYNRGKPVAHWKMDECEGGTIHDSVGTNHGTWSGTGGGTQTSVGTCSTSGTAWGNGATGRFNASLNFDGTDDYICSDLNSDGTCDNSNDLNIVGATSYSVWIKTGDSSGQIMGGSSIGSGDFKLSLGLGGSSVPYAPSAFCASSGEAVSSVTVNDGSWHHIVAIYIPSTSITIYQDGVQTAQDTSITNCSDTNNPFYIGANGSNYFLSGQIDDARVYNYALSADQVSQLTNEGFATRFGE